MEAGRPNGPIFEAYTSELPTESTSRSSVIRDGTGTHQHIVKGELLHR